jgi:hypothetical protein
MAADAFTGERVNNAAANYLIDQRRPVPVCRLKTPKGP